VAVRARNAKVLLATCYDPRTMDKLKALAGRVLRLELSAAGDVTFQEGEEPSAVPSRPPVANRPKIARPQFRAYAIAASQFNEKLVGGKSWNQVHLRPKLPGWVHQPASAAVPFGVFERVLALDHNQALADRYTALLSNLESNVSQTLAELREAVLKLSPPDDLVRTLRQVMDSAGLPRLDETPHSWNAAWTCIKRVWASKWNERAYLSRKASGFADEDLFMAVLIQQVVDAEYAFVIHTVNPLNGARSELYGEVVLGLGETLVANYPGRALSFACDKATLKPGIVAYPSKAVGLYGSGLIFRSDSNGEDLAGYAGAGLYDSVLLNPPREVCLDYSRERLVWDDAFRSDLLVSIAKIGAEVEKALGSPQDIEGAYSHGKYYVVQTRPQVG
jgi:alpha-glucan, water dikinase